MRIACLSRIVMAHGVHGGMEHHLHILASELVRRGHEVEIFTTAHPQGLSYEEINGVQCHYLNAPSSRYTRAWWRESLQAWQRANAQAAFDLVWSQSAGGEAIARIPRRERPPLVTILHGTFISEVQTRWQNLFSLRNLALIGLMYGRYLRWQAHVKEADVLIAVSHIVARQLQAYYRSLPCPIVILNGVDVIQFARKPDLSFVVRGRLGLSPSAKMLISVGRLQVEKGLHLLLQALARLRRPGVHLLIVGQGRDEARLRRLAQRYRLASQVHFTGFVPHEELPAYLNAADIFVMPTLCVEGLPMVILEAMACGLPIVASDIGGIPTAVDHGRNGLLFPPGDVDQLAGHIGRLLDEPGLACALGEAARAKAVEQFSLERMVRDTEAVFLRVVHEARRRESLSG
ncbi:MAG: glycosyltransferase family 4 protein [Anaerolineae bacterium]|nr:glycosyltransferase family 4 protein [Anaerolineae bacterium]MDW8098482.1 glycosyltransferase family 4 protein [Anaerolineae bacterium]